MKIIIATIRSWNIKEAEKFIKKYGCQHSITLISTKAELCYDNIYKISPDYIFFPHWSDYIPTEIFEKYCCVVFHMTDLPFGRGGSPLQNLIERGYKETKISAIRVVEQLDAGPIFLKEDLDLQGSAQEIFERAAKIIFWKMIPHFMTESLVAIPQSGEIIEFKRRKPEQSQLSASMDIDKIYDYIRMLDAEGYPRAYIPFGSKRINFSNASLQNGRVTATVELVEE